MGNTFNNLTKKVLELEKEIYSDKEILTGKINSQSNIANTGETASAAAIYDSGIRVTEFVRVPLLL